MSLFDIRQGDCLDLLPALGDEAVDLVYLDPPFNSGRDFVAFDDRWDSQSEYLDFMQLRLEALHRALKPTGSLYLHCDPTASHYLKVVLDCVFGAKNFRNDIVWCYRGMPTKAKKWQAKSDNILFYTKSSEYTFNVQYGEPTEGSKKTFESGRRIGYNVNLSRKMATVFDWGKYNAAVESGTIPDDLRSVEFSGGKPPMRNWWDDIKILGGPGNNERTGWPTQKPLALLRRIISASSNEGDLVLDPFCGSGTTGVAALELGRRFIGMDISEEALELSRKRLAKAGNFSPPPAL